MPVLSDSELRMVAEVVAEMARCRGTSFGKSAKGYAFARAALIDPAFKARIGAPPFASVRRPGSISVAPPSRSHDRSSHARAPRGVPFYARECM